MAHQPPPAGLSYSNYPYQQPAMPSMAPPQNGNQQHPPYNMTNGQIPPMKPVQQIPQQQQAIPSQQINYQQFQTKAVNNALNGSSALSSRTSSPGVQAQAIPPSQLPPSRSFPSYQQFQQPQGSSQLPSTAPIINNNNNNIMSQQIPPGTQPPNLSASMKNLTLNSGPLQQHQQHPMPPMPSSKSDQNFLNNNNGVGGVSSAMPPKPTSMSNISNMPLRPAYPSSSGVQSPVMNQMPAQPMYPQQQPQQLQSQFPQQNHPAMQQQPRNLQYQNLNQYPAQQQQPQQQQQYPHPGNIVSQGFSKMWGRDSVDLLQNRHILPQTKVLPPPIKLANMFHESANCSPDIFRCTLTKIPESNSLLQKSRLPLGVLIHPYRDLSVSFLFPLLTKL